ncbi:M48 family metallopeptidase [Candidatus Saccharibacteria bacterium]|nr:M48 family metallopeptidase [Candidatus Saccharibacteria bacterium]
MSTITDEEFGLITIRRSSRSTHVKISVAPNGTLRASLPLYAPLFMLKRLVKSSRDELRSMIDSQLPKYTLENGMAIGKSHTLVVSQTHKPLLSVTRNKQQINVELPEGVELSDAAVIENVRAVIITALRIEAKSYLPKRLAFLARDMQCDYERVRFSHASGRWGSCSSTGTISLNIALMKLPHELIDYVLIHELCHTKQMNHSDQFWALVAAEDPSYKLHRKALKLHTPSV